VWFCLRNFLPFINGPLTFRPPKLAVYLQISTFNPLNAEVNPICHLLALLGAHPILHVSRIKVNYFRPEFLILFYFIFWIMLVYISAN